MPTVSPDPVELTRSCMATIDELQTLLDEIKKEAAGNDRLLDIVSDAKFLKINMNAAIREMAHGLEDAIAANAMAASCTTQEDMFAALDALDLNGIGGGDASDAKLAEAEIEIASLRSQLTAEREGKIDHGQDQAMLYGTVQSLESQLAERKNEIADLKRRLEGAEANAAEFERQAVFLAGELSELQSEMDRDDDDTSIEEDPPSPGAVAAPTLKKVRALCKKFKISAAFSNGRGKKELIADLRAAGADI